MAASESQQWYIEEIPATEQDGEQGEACGRPPVSVKRDDEDTAPKAFITVDTGAGTLDTAQSKVEATVRNGIADTMMNGGLRSSQPGRY